MSNIRPIVLETDYPLLVKWWEGHGAAVMPKHIIPQGWIISRGGIDTAACFLMLAADGTWALIEFLVTNPDVAFSRYLVDDVRELVAHIEQVALAQGCTFAITFVAPDTGEERMMNRIGYIPAPGPAHRTLCKSLIKEEA